MRHRSIQIIHAYWAHLSRGRPAPNRTEIDPRALAPVLGDVFLIDGESEELRFRLAGSRIVESLGRSLTGAPFSVLWSESGLQLAEKLMQIAKSGEPVLAGLRVASERASQRRAAGARLSEERRARINEPGEMVLLPLRHEGRLGARLLGGLVLEREAGPLPRPASFLDLTGTRMLGPASRPRTPLGLVGREIAETVVARRGHLMLLRGARDEAE